MALSLTRKSGSAIDSMRIAIHFGILQIAQFCQLTHAHVRISIFEAQLYVFDDREGRLLRGVTGDIVYAGTNLTLVRRRIVAKCATKALTTELRERYRRRGENGRRNEGK